VLRTLLQCQVLKSSGSFPLWKSFDDRNTFLPVPNSFQNNVCSCKWSTSFWISRLASSRMVSTCQQNEFCGHFRVVRMSSNSEKMSATAKISCEANLKKVARCKTSTLPNHHYSVRSGSKGLDARIVWTSRLNSRIAWVLYLGWLHHFATPQQLSPESLHQKKLVDH